MIETIGETERSYDHIRTERPEDSLAIDEVVRLAFGQDDEVLLVRALRDGGFNLLSLVATSQDEVIGHLLFTRLPIVGDRQTWNAVSLAPLAVIPAKQRGGVGSALLQVGLRQLQERRETIVVVLGHEHFYTRFGFTAKAAEPLAAMFHGPAWMALELALGALEGVRAGCSMRRRLGVSCQQKKGRKAVPRREHVRGRMDSALGRGALPRPVRMDSLALVVLA